MWHEARKQERRIRGLIVDYRKRAERRQDFYERIQADPTQFIQVHGRRCKIHLDPAVAAAGDGAAIIVPWQGHQDNLIDRFDVRAHLDYITPVAKQSEESIAEITNEERQCNYERYRILAQNDFLNVTEEKFLHQLYLEEQYGANAQLDAERNLMKKKQKNAGVTIGYTYDETELSIGPQPFSHLMNVNLPSVPSAVNTTKSENDSGSESESDIDMDVAIEVTKLDTSQAHELNACGRNYGMLSNDFYSYLTKDADEADAMRMAREEEQEKMLLSGRKSRRERRAQKERRIACRPFSPPSYAAKEDLATAIVEKKEDDSDSNSASPDTNTGKITYITSFGGEDELQPHSKISINMTKGHTASQSPLTLGAACENARAATSRTTYAQKVKENIAKLDLMKQTYMHRSRSHSRDRKSLSRSRSRLPSLRSREKYPRRRRRNSSSSSEEHYKQYKLYTRGRSKKRSRSRSKATSKSRSKSRSQTRSRSRSRTKFRSKSGMRPRSRSKLIRKSQSRSRVGSRSRSRSRTALRRRRYSCTSSSSSSSSATSSLSSRSVRLRKMRKTIIASNPNHRSTRSRSISPQTAVKLKLSIDSKSNSYNNKSLRNESRTTSVVTTPMVSYPLPLRGMGIEGSAPPPQPPLPMTTGGHSKVTEIVSPVQVAPPPPLKRYYGRKRGGDTSSESETTESERDEKKHKIEARAEVVDVKDEKAHIDVDTISDSSNPLPNVWTSTLIGTSQTGNYITAHNPSLSNASETKGGTSSTGAGSESRLNVRERLKKRMQNLLNKQYKADKRAEIEKTERERQLQQERDDEMRELALKLRRRQRELRHKYGTPNSSRASDSDTSVVTAAVVDETHKNRRSRSHSSERPQFSLIPASSAAAETKKKSTDSDNDAASVRMKIVRQRYSRSNSHDGKRVKSERKRSRSRSRSYYKTTTQHRRSRSRSRGRRSASRRRRRSPSMSRRRRDSSYDRRSSRYDAERLRYDARKRRSRSRSTRRGGSTERERDWQRNRHCRRDADGERMKDATIRDQRNAGASSALPAGGSRNRIVISAPPKLTKLVDY